MSNRKNVKLDSIFLFLLQQKSSLRFVSFLEGKKISSSYTKGLSSSPYQLEIALLIWHIQLLKHGFDKYSHQFTKALSVQTQSSLSIMKSSWER